jgi:transposase-like protein
MPKRRRRTFTAEFKAQIVLKVLTGLTSQAEVARQHKLKPERVARWKKTALEGLETLFQGGEQRDQDDDRIAELEIRGWELGRGLDQGLTLAAFRRAMRRGRRPEVHQSDQGVQYAATAYTEFLAGRGVAISVAAVGKPEENGFAERLMRTFREEEVDRSLAEDRSMLLG